MKVLIRHPATKLYQGKAGSWLEDWKMACHFPTSAVAIKFCISEKLITYQVVMKSEVDSQHEIVVFEGNPTVAVSRLHFFGAGSKRPRKTE